MPGVARSADNRALGYRRPGGGERLCGGSVDGLQGSLSPAEPAHRHLHGASAALPRPANAQGQASGYRRDGRRHQDLGTELMASGGRRIFSEWLGTAFLLAAVVGSGIMAQKLSGGNLALALLCNTIPTGTILVVLILVFG